MTSTVRTVRMATVRGDLHARTDCGRSADGGGRSVRGGSRVAKDVARACGVVLVTQLVRLALVVSSIALARFANGWMGLSGDHLRFQAAWAMSLGLTGAIVVLLSRRWLPSPGGSASAAGSLLLSLLLLAPLSMAIAACLPGEVTAAAGLRWTLLPVSVGIVAAHAFAEEIAYRALFLDLWASAGLPIAVGLLLQAMIFAAAHGRFATISAGHFAWFALTGLMLGLVYQIWHSVLLATLVHTVLNVSQALVGPSPTWYAGRLVSSLPDVWRDIFSLLQCVLMGLMAVLLVRRHRASRRPRTPSGHPPSGEPQIGVHSSTSVPSGQRT